MSTDADLLRAHLGGDQDAFAELVRRHLPLVRAACTRQLDAVASAAVDDAVQAVFLVLARKAEPLSRSPASLAPWLHTVAHHVARNQRRIERRHARASVDAPAAEPLAPEAGDPWVEIRPHLDAALEALPAPYRRTLVLHYLDGLDRAAVGAALGVSVEAVKKRIGRGLDLLRGRLARRGVRLAGRDLASCMAVLQAQAHAPAPMPAGAVTHAIARPTATATHLATGASSSMTIAKILAAAAHVLALTGPVGAIAAIACGIAAERTLRAEAADGTPPPAITIARTLTPGTCFYYASLLRWTFDMDDGAANNFLKDSITVSPVTELDIWRVEVSEDEHHQRIMRLTSTLTWAAMGPNPQSPAVNGTLTATMDLPGQRKMAVRIIPNAAFCQPGVGDEQTAIVDGAPAPLTTLDVRTASFGPALTRLGIRDLLWPLPAQLQSHVPTAVQDGQVMWCAGDASAPTLHYTYTTHKAWPKLFSQDFQLGNASIPATFDINADGSGEATISEDAASQLPASATSRLKAHVIIKPNITGMVITLGGTFAIQRDAWRLPAVVDPAAPPEALTRALAPARGRILGWSLSTEATLSMVGKGVLDAIDHPPHIIEPAPPAGAPTPAPKAQQAF